MNPDQLHLIAENQASLWVKIKNYVSDTELYLSLHYNTAFRRNHLKLSIKCTAKRYQHTSKLSHAILNILFDILFTGKEAENASNRVAAAHCTCQYILIPHFPQGKMFYPIQHTRTAFGLACFLTSSGYSKAFHNNNSDLDNRGPIEVIRTDIWGLIFETAQLKTINLQKCVAQNNLTFSFSMLSTFTFPRPLSSQQLQQLAHQLFCPFGLMGLHSSTRDMEVRSGAEPLKIRTQIYRSWDFRIYFIDRWTKYCRVIRQLYHSAPPSRSTTFTLVN